MTQSRKAWTAGLTCSLYLPMFSLIGAGHSGWIRGVLGVFSAVRILYPQKYPQSDVVGVICAHGRGRVPMSGSRRLG